MEKNKKQEKTYTRKRLNSIILLLAFAAIMLIVSTYAWFSTQKNVAITNLAGTVQIAEGMEISLDGVHFKQTLDLSQVDWTVTSNTAEYPVYAGNTNNIPEELQPVSTVGTVNTSDLTFYRGTYISDGYGRRLRDITACAPAVTNPDTNVGGIGTVSGEEGSEVFEALEVSDPTYPGYYAFDVFIKNTIQGGENKDGVSNYAEDGAETPVWGTDLQLNSDSFAKILEKVTGDSNKINTIDWENNLNSTDVANMANTLGTQNTIRVGLAVYDTTADVTSTNVVGTTVTSSSRIRQLAIWEPNSSRHVEDVVNQLSHAVLWDTEDNNVVTAGEGASLRYLYNPWTAYSQVPTYAVVNTGTTLPNPIGNGNLSNAIDNIYTWAGRTGAAANSLALQRTVKTTPLLLDSENHILAANDPSAEGAVTNYNEIHEGVTTLTDISETPVNFHIDCNKVSRVRVFLWMEGQDVDTLNVASMGHGVQVNLDLITGETEHARSENTVVVATTTEPQQDPDTPQEP